MTVVDPLTATCDLDDLPVERGVAALVDGRQIALFRLTDGTVHAVDHHDPATGANVLARGLLGTSEGRWYVASPLLKHRYFLDDGSCATDASLRLDVHDVRVRDGVVHVIPTPGFARR